MDVNNITEIKTGKSVWTSPYVITLVLGLGVFMITLDVFVFSPALSVIVNDLHTSYDLVTWAVTIFMLFMTAITPIGGKFADTFGRKKVFIIGISIFTLGSIACSLSWDIYSLIVFRAIQAIGSGIVFPAAMAAANYAVPDDKKGKTMGALYALASLAMVVGPNVGGFFIQHFGWRSIFYINVPIGVLAVLFASRFTESHGGVKSIDIVGSTLILGFLFTFLLGIVGLGNSPVYDITVFPLFVVSALLAILLVWYEKRTKAPVLDMPLLAQGKVLSLNMAMLLTNISLICIILFVPTFAQIILHLNVQDSGIILTPFSVSLFVFSIVGGVLMDRFGAKKVILTGAIVIVPVLFWLAEYVNDSTTLLITMAFVGAGIGLSMGAFQVIMLSFMPENQKATGSGILNTFKNTGNTIGSVVGGFLLADAANRTVTFSHAFNNIFLLATATAILATVLVIYLYIGRHNKTSMPAVEAHVIKSVR